MTARPVLVLLAAGLLLAVPPILAPNREPATRSRGDGPPARRSAWDVPLPEPNRAARRDWSITVRRRPGAKARRR